MIANLFYQLWGTDAAGTKYNNTSWAVTPKVVIGQSVGPTGGGSGGRLNHRRTIGFATSPSSRWSVGAQSEDNNTTSTTDKAQRTDCALTKISTAGAIDALLDYDTFGSGGMIWIVDDATPSAEYYQGIAIAGTEITNVATGVFDQATATGNSDITTVGFQPDFVMLLSSYGIAPEPDIRAGGSLGIGVCDAALNQWTYGSRAIDALGTSDTGTYMKSGQVIGVPTTAAGIGTCLVRAEITSMLSNGFRIHYTEVDATVRRFGYLAVKGGHWKVGSLLSQTDTTTKSTVTLGWRPAGGFMVSACRAESTDDVPTPNDVFSMGFFGHTLPVFVGSYEGVSMATRDEDNQAVTAVTIQDGLTGQVYINPNPTSGAVDGSAVITSITDGGFSIIMDNADASQCFIGYVAVGEPVVGLVGSGVGPIAETN